MKSRCFDYLFFNILNTSNRLSMFIFVVVQLLSHVRLFATPWTAAHQASLSFIISQSLLKLRSIESVMPSKHLILWFPSLPAFNLSQHQGLFQSVSSWHQVAKVLEFQLQHQSFQWILRTYFLYFRIDWFDLLAVQETLKSLCQNCSSKSINFLALSFLYSSTPTSIHNYWKNYSFD